MERRVIPLILLTFLAPFVFLLFYIYMSAKDIILDFFYYVFIIGLSIFVFYYIVLGDRFAIFTEIKTLVALAFFAVPLLIIIKLRRTTIKKLRKEDDLDEIITYLTTFDKIKDRIVTVFLPVFIVGLAVLDGYIDTADYFQAVVSFVVIFLWHSVLFKKKGTAAGLSYLTNLDKIKDEFVTFLLPIIIISIGVIDKNVDVIDFFQALIVFLIMYFWHKILFKKAY